MSPKQLAAAIRNGHTMIGEAATPYIGTRGGKPCGCALGAAYVGSGMVFPSEFLDRIALQSTAQIAKAIGIPFELATSVSSKHFQGTPRLAIADWLDTLEPETKPADKQTFDAFMATVLAPNPELQGLPLESPL